MISRSLFPNETTIELQTSARNVVSKELRKHRRSSFHNKSLHTSESNQPMRSVLRRCKSLPAHLMEDEYTGKPLFWFRRKPDRTTRYHNLAEVSAQSNSQERPPRPFIRLLRKPILKNRRCTGDQPFLVPETRNDSFDTLATAVSEDVGEEYHDQTIIDYSDDEDDGDEEGESLRGLSFLEEDQQERE